MPKKFVGENSKSAQARARKDAVKQAETERKQREEEDALWADDDKHVQRKQQRKEMKEKKRQEVLEKKVTAKAMLEQEVATIKSAKVAPNKLTRSDIIDMQEKQAGAGGAKKALVHDELPLEENINRLEADVDSARNVDDAIAVLSVKEFEQDRHPERRMKAAYQAYEDANMARVKAENPNLRLSQLKQLIWKDWLKAPENPLNQVLN